MDKEMSLKNRDRLIQLGITISTFRKYRGLSQEQLAERASVSRSLISSIEAAGIAKTCYRRSHFVTEIVYRFLNLPYRQQNSQGVFTLRPNNIKFLPAIHAYILYRSPIILLYTTHFNVCIPD